MTGTSRGQGVQGKNHKGHNSIAVGYFLLTLEEKERGTFS